MKQHRRAAFDSRGRRREYVILLYPLCGEINPMCPSLCLSCRADSDARFVHDIASLRTRPHGEMQKEIPCDPELHEDNKNEPSNCSFLISLNNPEMGNHITGNPDSSNPHPSLQSDNTKVQVSLSCSTFWAWEPPVSPHLAAQPHPPAALPHLKQPAGITGHDDAVQPAQSHSHVVGDMDIVNACRSFLDPSSNSREVMSGTGKEQRLEEWVIVETAGGVLSPAPSGNLQADAYRYGNDSCLGHALPPHSTEEFSQF